MIIQFFIEVNFPLSDFEREKFTENFQPLFRYFFSLLCVERMENRHGAYVQYRKWDLENVLIRDHTEKKKKQFPIDVDRGKTLENEFSLHLSCCVHLNDFLVCVLGLLSRTKRQRKKFLCSSISRALCSSKYFNMYTMNGLRCLLFFITWYQLYKRVCKHTHFERGMDHELNFIFPSSRTKTLPSPFLFVLLRKNARSNSWKCSRAAWRV
jgi:hypothetical protein